MKFTHDQIKAIWKDYRTFNKSYKFMSEKYDCSSATIRKVVHQVANEKGVELPRKKKKKVYNKDFKGLKGLFKNW